VEPVDGVRVVAASGSGDDAIVDVVAAAAGRAERAGRWRSIVVVTADKELRSRVAQLGAELAGPRTVRP
jgi:rRNA-processing protein FCF1